MMYAVLSDIHGNLYALESVAKDLKRFEIDGIILLGDLIDYGMQSNEVVCFIQDELQNEIICNIWGNHERAILLEDYNGFSSQRGVESAKHTAAQLTAETQRYLNDKLDHSGMLEFKLSENRILAVHGSLNNHFWKAISPDNVWGDYNDYDIVLSGHSHNSHMFTKFYDVNDPDRRNKHSVLFINPGAVGQPRNHNSSAQYVLLDDKKMSIEFHSVPYDIEAAMSLYDGNVDLFYRDRLKVGV